jgi:hypothetical protein
MSQAQTKLEGVAATGELMEVLDRIFTTNRSPQAQTIIKGYLTTPELATELGRLIRADGKPLCKRTIYNYENAAPALPFTTVGKTKLYRLEDVHAWLEERRCQKNVR